MVDNGSTDDTVQVAQETADHLGLPLRVVEEPVAGKHATLPASAAAGHAV